jgi:hypothetical protein
MYSIGDDPCYLPVKAKCSWPLCIFIFLFQSRCRQFLARLHYSRTKKAAITTQCAWRGKVARKELRKLKLVSSSTLGGRQFCSTNAISVAYTYFSSQLTVFLLILLFIRLPGKLVHCKLPKINLKSKLRSLHGGYSWRSACEWVLYSKICSSHHVHAIQSIFVTEIAPSGLTWRLLVISFSTIVA